MSYELELRILMAQERDRHLTTAELTARTEASWWLVQSFMERHRQRATELVAQADSYLKGLGY